MKLFRKPKSKFYWYDFTVRGQRYRGSTRESNAAKAATLASLTLAQVVDGTSWDASHPKRMIPVPDH